MTCKCSPQDVHDYGPCGEDCGSLAVYSKADEPHDEQVQLWSEDVAEAMQPWLRDFQSYDDKIDFFTALNHQLKQIGEAAHAAGMLRAKT